MLKHVLVLTSKVLTTLSFVMSYLLYERSL